MEKVTCIMPTTTARKNFVTLAIRYFLRQDYPDKELLILGDGEGTLAALIPERPDIRYIHHAGKFTSLGDKRNYACAAAGGTIIQHWDDDDWYAADWISRQVAALSVGDTAISGLGSLYFYNPEQQLSWQYRYNLDSRPWVAGATLAYWKSVWQERPFPGITVGEDNQFVWRSGVKVNNKVYPNGFVSLLHPGNTSPKHTRDRQWHPVQVQTVEEMMGADRHHYQRHQEPQ